MRPERFEVVSVLDDAIDTASIPLQTMIDYTETRDFKLIAQHMLPGQQPTKFHVRAVPHSLWESYVCGAGEHDEIRFRRAFICGVVKVDNLLGNDGIGIPWEPTKVLNDKLTIMTDEECNSAFSPAEVLEIGSVIFKHSFLPLRRKLTWSLPRSLAEPLGQRRFLLAGSSQPTATMTTNSQPSASTDRRPAGTEQPSV